MENNEWKDKIPFGYYNTGEALNKIRVDKIPCTLVIKGVKSNATEENKKTMRLFIERNNFDKCLNKELSVLEIYANSVSLKETRHHINLNNWDFAFKIDNIEVPLDKLLQEFINKGEPGAGTYLEQMIPTVSERKEQLNQNKGKIKSIKP